MIYGDTIGERIKRARKDAEMTQNELASKTGTIFQTISKYERNETRPSFLTMLHIANALNCCVFELYPVNSEERVIQTVAEAAAIEKAKESYEINDYNDDAVALISVYLNMLSEAGQDEAVKRVEELTHIDKYNKKTQP